jgi:hypothetical protein
VALSSSRRKWGLAILENTPEKKIDNYVDDQQEIAKNMKRFKSFTNSVPYHVPLCQHLS